RGGNIAEAGAVGWVFALKGYIAIEKNKVNEETLMTLALDAGAEDMKASDEDVFEIFTAPSDFEKVREAVKSKNIPIQDAQITMIPSTTVPLTGKDAENVLNLVQ